MRPLSGGSALAKRVRLPGLRQCEGLGTVDQAVDFGVCGLRSANLRYGRHGDAAQQVAADRMVHRDATGRVYPAVLRLASRAAHIDRNTVRAGPVPVLRTATAAHFNHTVDTARL